MAGLILHGNTVLLKISKKDFEVGSKQQRRKEMDPDSEYETSPDFKAKLVL
jgi:hypothetical protein